MKNTKRQAEIKSSHPIGVNSDNLIGSQQEVSENTLGKEVNNSNDNKGNDAKQNDAKNKETTFEPEASTEIDDNVAKQLANEENAKKLSDDLAKNAKVSKELKQKHEDEASSDDEIKLLQLNTKQTKRRRILESYEEVEVEKRSLVVEVTKKSLDSGKRNRNNHVDSSLKERSHSAKCPTCKGASTYFQNKDVVNLDVHGINLHDDILTNDVFLDDSGDVSTQKVSTAKIISV